MGKKVLPIALLLGIVLCSALAIFLRPVNLGTVVEVRMNNNLVQTILLSEVETPYTFTLESGNGGYNIIAVTPDTVHISEANCPDLLCVHQGNLIEGQPIVCLPHRVSIQFRSEGGGLDGLSQ
ncbi:MAG: NusG domain II-containing protein [Eubacteriales bacterium]